MIPTTPSGSTRRCCSHRSRRRGGASTASPTSAIVSTGRSRWGRTRPATPPRPRWPPARVLPASGVTFTPWQNPAHVRWSHDGSQLLRTAEWVMVFREAEFGTYEGRGAGRLRRLDHDGRVEPGLPHGGQRRSGGTARHRPLRRGVPRQLGASGQRLQRLQRDLRAPTRPARATALWLRRSAAPGRRAASSIPASVRRRSSRRPSTRQRGRRTA